ncbi:MAG: glycosyltransferase [Anaerolineales bacterium]|nr:glycosyltransferase [Anaerolineales bacterium]
MSSPAVSVLLPCYNGGAALDRSLQSISQQTFENFELIAVDDGSTDESPAVLARWSEADPRLTVIRQDHRGIVAALQAGLEACSAPLVARMDHDDYAHPERLALQKEFLEANPDIAVAGCLVRGAPEGAVQEGLQIYLAWQNSLVAEADIRREIFIESPFVHPSVMFRSDAVRAAGGYQEHGWPEDYDLWLRLYLQGAGFGKVPQVLFDWYERPGRLTRADSRYSLENFLRAKACYLARGPLAGREEVFIWGAGMTGRRLTKQLERQDAPLKAFIDVDPAKIGKTRRGLPVLAPAELPELWTQASQPVLLAAVRARRARPLIRRHIAELGLEEGQDWWFAA